ncbi:MAG: FAD synthetase family protein [Spirochaetales bacterium]|nr:FAD synthetase family protein [Spirochaetales bacterium]
MNVLGWNEFLQKKAIRKDPIALSIGVFDGVHRGHQTLIHKITSYTEWKPWVITFHPNPSRIIRPGEYPGDIMTKRQKLRTFSDLELDTTVIIDFSWEFGKLRGTEFLSFIQNTVDVRFVAVGENFHCGYNMDTSAWRMKELLEPKGIGVQILPSVRRGGEPISSTRIRNTILEGNIFTAIDLLGHPFELDLEDLPVYTEEGRSLLERKAVPQVLPRRGTFSVEFRGPEGKRGGILEIEEEFLSWHSNGAIDAIVFT